MLITRRQLVGAGVTGAVLATSPVLANVVAPRDARGMIGGVSGRFLRDPSVPGILLLDGRASAKLGLWDSDRSYVPLRSYGFGGAMVRTRMYRLDGLMLNGKRHDGALVRVMAPGEASSGFSQYNGVAGAGPSEDYPMSGLWLKKYRGKLLIGDVGKGSPAWKAGLRVGDRIIDEERDELVARLCGAEGERIALIYQRNGKQAQANFILQRYL